MSQWVVRLLDKCVTLPANITAIEVVSSHSIGDMLDDVSDMNTRDIEDQLDSTIECRYWVCIRYYDVCMQTGARLPQLTVLCSTDTDCAAERMLGILYPAMFARHGQDMFIDFRKMLTEDFAVGMAITASAGADESTESTPSGRFIDLDEVGIVHSARSRRRPNLNMPKAIKDIMKATIAVVPLDHASNVEDYDKTIGSIMQHDRNRSATGTRAMRGVSEAPLMMVQSGISPAATSSTILGPGGSSSVPSIGTGVSRGVAPNPDPNREGSQVAEVFQRAAESIRRNQSRATAVLSQVANVARLSDAQAAGL